jgi:hypothetical protein
MGREWEKGKCIRIDYKQRLWKILIKGSKLWNHIPDSLIVTQIIMHYFVLRPPLTNSFIKCCLKCMHNFLEVCCNLYLYLKGLRKWISIIGLHSQSVWLFNCQTLCLLLLTICRSYLKPYCMGRNTMFFFSGHLIYILKQEHFRAFRSAGDI